MHDMYVYWNLIRYYAYWTIYFLQIYVVFLKCLWAFIPFPEYCTKPVLPFSFVLFGSEEHSLIFYLDWVLNCLFGFFLSAFAFLRSGAMLIIDCFYISYSDWWFSNTACFPFLIIGLIKYSWWLITIQKNMYCYLFSFNGYKNVR